MHRPGRYASLREGLVGAWCPSVSGAFGYSLPDLSGYGNNGTLTNMDPATDWVASGGKMALDFDGVNDYVDLGDWYGGLKALSLTASINARTVPGPGSVATIVGKWNNETAFDSSDSFVLNYGSGQGLRFYLGGPNDGITSGSSLFSADVTYHVAAVWNGSVATLWINGSSVASKSITGNLNVANGISTKIGRNLSASSAVPVNGVIDDVRIYNRALTPPEIQQLYIGGRGVGLTTERRRWFYQAPSLFTASASLTTGAATCSGSATHTPPTYTGTSAVTTAAATCSGSATFTAPTYTAAASVTIAAATCSASGTFVTPVNTGTSVITVGAATASGAATFAVPVYTASANVAVGATLVNVAGSVVAPVYTAAAAVTVGAAVASGVALFGSNKFVCGRVSLSKTVTGRVSMAKRYTSRTRLVTC